MDNLYISLPVVLYILGIILLIILIILGIKLLRMLNHVDEIIQDVDGKVKSLNGIFQFIDTATDKLSFVTDRMVENISNFFLKLFKKKGKIKEEEEENE
jgi:uncharacterized protein YoxC